MVSLKSYEKLLFCFLSDDIWLIEHYNFVKWFFWRSFWVANMNSQEKSYNVWLRHLQILVENDTYLVNICSRAMTVYRYFSQMVSHGRPWTIYNVKTISSSRFLDRLPFCFVLFCSIMVFNMACAFVCLLLFCEANIDFLFFLFKDMLLFYNVAAI